MMSSDDLKEIIKCLNTIGEIGCCILFVLAIVAIWQYVQCVQSF